MFKFDRKYKDTIMRLPFMTFMKGTLYAELLTHVEKVKECAWIYQKAVEFYLQYQVDEFMSLKEQILKLKQEADSLREKLRYRLPNETKLSIDKYRLFIFLERQDQILTAVEDALDWLGFCPQPAIIKSVAKQFYVLCDMIVETVEALSQTAEQAWKYIQNTSRKQLDAVNEAVKELHQKNREAHKAENELKKMIFNVDADPKLFAYQIGLAEKIGMISTCSEKAGDILSIIIFP